MEAVYQGRGCCAGQLAKLTGLDVAQISYGVGWYVALHFKCILAGSSLDFLSFFVDGGGPVWCYRI